MLIPYQPSHCAHCLYQALGMPRLAAGPAEAAVAEGRAEGLHHGRLLRSQLRGQEQRGAHQHALLLAQLFREAHINAHQQVALRAACAHTRWHLGAGFRGRAAAQGTSATRFGAIPRKPQISFASPRVDSYVWTAACDGGAPCRRCPHQPHAARRLRRAPLARVCSESAHPGSLPSPPPLSAPAHGPCQHCLAWTRNNHACCLVSMPYGMHNRLRLSDTNYKPSVLARLQHN